MIENLQQAITKVKAEEGAQAQNDSMQAQAKGRKPLPYKTKHCRYFQQGGCNRGDSCSYIHENPAPTPAPFVQPPSNQMSIPPFQQSQRQPPCMSFYQWGRCLNGDGCAYSHEPEPEYMPVSLNQMVQTPVCKLYPHGLCQRGDTCIFVHDSPYVPVPPPQYNPAEPCPNMAPPVQYGPAAPSPNVPAPQPYKANPCRFFQQNGHCGNGDACNYLHDPRAVSTDGPQKGVKEKHPLYKTRVCTRWSNEGFCHLGLNCSFLHPDPGSADGARLAEIEADKTRAHPRYKTRVCRYWQEGKCPYGGKCSYLHQEQ